MKRVRYLIAVAISLGTFGFCAVVYAEMTLNRYGRLTRTDEELLARRTTEILESDDLEACEKWLAPELRQHLVDAKNEPVYGKVQDELKKALEGKGEVRVTGNYRFARVALYPPQDGHVIPTYLPYLEWIRKRDDWQIIRLYPLTPPPPRGPFEVEHMESFLQKHQIILPLLCELRFAAMLETSLSSEDVKIILVSPGVEGVADGVPWLVLSSPEAFPEALERSSKKEGSKGRVWGVRIKRAQSLGSVIRLLYFVTGYPTNYDQNLYFTATAYFEQLPTGAWVVTDLFHGRATYQD